MADPYPDRTTYSAQATIGEIDPDGRFTPSSDLSRGEIWIDTEHPIEIDEWIRKQYGLGWMAPFRELVKGDGRKFQKAVTKQRASQQPPLPPLPPPEPAPAAPQAPVEGTPVADETLETFGSPGQVNVPVRILREAGFEIDPDDPEPEHYDLAQGFGPGEIALRIEPAPVSDAELQDFLERLRRNRYQRGHKDPTQLDPRPVRPAVDADPIELATGVFTLQMTDLEVPTPHLPIALVRSYRSGRPYDGPFGFGWDHNFNVYLRRLKDGSLALWAGGLRELYFKPTGSGWDGAEGVFAKAVESPTVPGEFEVRWRGGRVWRLARPAAWSDPERIPLHSIVDRAGRSLTLDYDAKDRLAQVSDHDGRGLRFAYGSCDLLERVTDHTGKRTVEYHHHDGIEVLVRVVQPATAMFPEGISTSYQYDLDSAVPAMRFNLLRILDARDRLYLENRYAAPGESWAFNGVVWQRSGDDIYELEYEHVQYVPEDPQYLDVVSSRTRVQSPDGTLHEYSFNYRGEVLDHRVRLSRDGSYRVLADQAQYDALGNRILVVRPDGSKTAFRYDTQNVDCRARGNLLSIEEIAALPNLAASRTVATLQYDPTYQLPTVVKDETGAETRYVYDFAAGQIPTQGRLLEVRLPTVTTASGAAQAAVESYSYTASGQIESIRSPAGVVIRCEYLGAGPHRGFVSSLLSGTGPERHRQDFGYDEFGFLSTIDDGPGQRTDLVANALGQFETCHMPEIDGHRAVIRQQFSEAGALARRDRPLGSSGHLWTSEPQITDIFEQDILGRTKFERRAANTSDERGWRYELDHEGRVLQQWSPTGRAERFHRDERGLVLRHVVGEGSAEAIETRYAYNRRGDLSRRIGPDGSETGYEYDVWGRLRLVRRPDGSEVSFGWGAGDRLVEYAILEGPDDQDGYLTALRRETFAYDARGRVVSHSVGSTFAGGPATSLETVFEHDADGRPVTVTDPYGATRKFTYDSVGRISASEDDFGNGQAWTYDAHANLASLSLSLANGAPPTVFAFEYDPWNRLVRSIEPGAEAGWRWDDANHVVTHHLGPTIARADAYNVHGDLVATTIDPSQLALAHAWARDDDGRVTSYQDPAGAVTAFRYDALGRLSRVTLPDQLSWDYSYDSVQRTVSRRAPSGATVRTTLDSDLARPLEIAVEGAPGLLPVLTHTFRYDGLGRIVEARSGTETVTRAYDSLGRLRAEIARGGTTAVDYDDSAHVRETTYPHGHVERAAFDSHGRPTSIAHLDGGAWAVDMAFQYDAAGRLAAAGSANGVTTAYAYDELGRVTEISAADGTVAIDGWRIAFDSLGHRALVQRAGGASQFHRFDTADRQIGFAAGFAYPQLPGTPSVAARAAIAAAAQALAQTAPVREAYVLDASDARRELHRVDAGSSNVTQYGLAAAHQTIAVDQTPVTYDVDGQRTTDSRYRYVFDAMGRLREVRERPSDALVHRLDYDPLLRDAAGRVGGAPYQRWYSDDGAIEEQSAGSTPQLIVRSFSAEGGPPWRVAVDGDVRYVVQDDHLSTSAIAGATPNVLRRCGFGPFGAPSVTDAGGAPASAPLGTTYWRGMARLEGTPLYRAAHRTYDSELGVFLSPDPLLYADSPSRYAYAGHNPADYADISGLAKTPLGRSEGERAEQADDWTTQTEWAYPKPDHRLIQPVTRYDTGNRPLNFVLNKVILPWRNQIAFYENVVLATAMGVDDALEHSPIRQEYHAAQVMLPLSGVMAIGVELRELLAGMQYARALASQVSARNLALNVSPLAAGGFGFGSLPLVRSASTRGSHLQFVGKTPVLSDAKWAQAQVSVGGSPHEYVFNKISRRGRVRQILVDSIDDDFVVEVKFGNMGQMFKPDRYDHTIQQSYNLIDIARSFPLRGVQYRVTTEVGAVRLLSIFTRVHREHLRSGFLVVRWYPFPFP